MSFVFAMLTKQARGKLSSSLFYLYCMFLSHGLYFGNLRHFRFRTTSPLVYPLVLVQVLFMADQLYHEYNLLTTNQFLGYGQSNEQGGMLPLEELKLGTRTVFFVITFSYNLQSLCNYIVLPYKGEQIIQLLNCGHYRHFDATTNFTPRFVASVEVYIFVFFCTQLSSWLPLFGADNRLGIVAFVVLCYINARQILWLYIIQFYALKVNVFWFRQLYHSALDPKTSLAGLKHCTVQVDILLRHLCTLYRVLNPYIFYDYVCFLSIFIFFFVYYQIGNKNANFESFMLSYCFLFLFNYLLIILLAEFQLRDKFRQLRKVLTKRTTRLWRDDDDRDNRTRLEVRIWCLSVDDAVDWASATGGPCPPPRVFDLFRFNLRSVVATIVFAFDFAVMLYQTEYL